MRRDAIRPSLLSFTALFLQTKHKVDKMKPQIGGFSLSSGSRMFAGGGSDEKIANSFDWEV